MTTRPAMDWTPLEWTSDPIPGDPDQVRRSGLTFNQTADAADGAAGHLRALQSGDGQCSEAISKIQERAGEAAADLVKVKTRYAGAASALLEYAEVLGHAQATSVRALHAADSASNERRAANVELAKVKAQAENSQDPQERQELIQHLMQVKSRRDNARGDLESAKALLRQAIDDRDKAAFRAKSDIDTAVSTSQLNDSTWDRVKEFLQGTVATVLDIVSIVCTVVALVLLATGIGAPLAGILLLVAAVTGGIAGLLKAWAKFDAGDTVGGWVELGFAVVSLFGAAKLLKVLRVGGMAGLGTHVTAEAVRDGVKVEKRLTKYFPWAKNVAMSKTVKAEKLLERANLRVKNLAGKPGAAGSRRIANLAYKNLQRVQARDWVKVHVAVDLAKETNEHVHLVPDRQEIVEMTIHRMEKAGRRAGSSKLTLQTAGVS